jgi:phospholipase C
MFLGGAIASLGTLGLPASQAADLGPNGDAAFRTHVAAPAVTGAADKQAPRRYSKATPGSGDAKTATPIKHVILIIGENRTFDHVFATYQPVSGQKVWNLLSEGIVNADGTPGPKVALAQQFQATVTDTYTNTPTKAQAYTTIPDINTDGAPTNPPFSTPFAAQMVEPALPPDQVYQLATGGTGLPNRVVDTRFPSNLPNAPVSLNASIPYDTYASSPVHRFFQMWQQLDCDPKVASSTNPSGCQSDLFPWVEVSIGAGNNGAPIPANFTDQTTGEGSTAMQFFNVAKGDVPYFTQLANQYSMNDNFHQSVMGGTGANHLMLGYGSLVYYADASGNPATPPPGQIENPNPQPGTNNWYIQDGYGDASTGGGGSYVNCADTTQPGVAPIMTYFSGLKYKPFMNGDCAPNAYYLVNNYNPGYLGDGTPAPLGADQFTIPPTMQNNIGLLLTKHDVSWRYYGEGFDGGKEDGEGGAFCNICDPFLYSTQIMTNPALRANNVDIEDLYGDIQTNSLPAIAIVKPDGLLDGHPASSKLDLFEGFCRKIIEMLQANPNMWKDTAVMITFDEGGGYWDSGYVQTIDFFGDGSRIPMIVVSPFSQGGKVVHTYTDHVSFDKFVEKNWQLGEKISPMGRDNLPNPTASADNPYVPTNQPAIGDLMDMFQFK